MNGMTLVPRRRRSGIAGEEAGQEIGRPPGERGGDVGDPEVAR
jgi:hypothetical protein